VAASASGQVRAGAHEDGVQMCVKRVHKRTAPGKKKRKKEKKKKRKEKKGMWTHCKPIHRLHGTGSSMPVVSLWVKGHGRSHADHRPYAEAVGGGDMWVMEKKNESEKNNQKKKSEKWTHQFKPPQKH